MAIEESSRMPLGSLASEFNLLDVVSGKPFTLKEVRRKHGLVVMFLCAHCPYVKSIEKEIAIVAKKYLCSEIGFVGISSNDSLAYPEDSLEKLKEQAEKAAFCFPYLFDETQEVAKAYQAACTPDFYLFDEHLKGVYHGRFDTSTIGNSKPVSGDSLMEAIDTQLRKEPPVQPQYPSIGCSIKWK